MAVNPLSKSEIQRQETPDANRAAGSKTKTWVVIIDLVSFVVPNLSLVLAELGHVGVSSPASDKKANV